jgi:hypothetical protein
MAVARDVFGLKGPKEGAPCQLGLTYQAVRNVAAVLELTGLRTVAAFGLLHDQRNPSFSGAGAWPGWARILEQLLHGNDRVAFRAVSWQGMIPLLPIRGRPSSNGRGTSTG